MLFCCALVVCCLSVELQPQSLKHELFSDEKEGRDRSSADKAGQKCVYLQEKEDLAVEYPVCETPDNVEYLFLTTEPGFLSSLDICL